MEIKEAIQILAAKEGEFYSKLGKVISIDKELNTCDVEPINKGADLLDVKLTATEGNKKGIIIYPKIGTNVLVTFLDNENSFVSMCTEIDEIIYNEGTNGGLINIETLISELDKNNMILNAIKTVVSSPIPEAGNGAPSALGTALNSALGSLQIGSFNSMEDEKFKH